MSRLKDIQSLLTHIYGQEKGSLAFEKIRRLMEKCRVSTKRAGERFSQEDVVLITYGDSLVEEDRPPLKTLFEFSSRYFKDVFNVIHFLPFFPYSSDDGFSVMDYYKINPDLGSWADIKAFSKKFDLMFDYVLNHISSKSLWFNQYLKAAKGYKSLAIEVDPLQDLSAVTRPRALPLLTPYEKENGEKVHLWTTFSEDQIDLNFQSVEVLEKMVKVLLFYVENHARFLRMDAVAYLWKEVGTNCIHHSHTHAMVKLFRKILDQVSPETVIITETNVPHNENIAYFGKNGDQAQMVYNFTLPPLLLHTFEKKDATAILRWAKGLDVSSEQTTFFNFTASHDGIGVRPLEGILPAADLEKVISRVKQNGGAVSYKQNPDGTKSPYELNITYIDALKDKGDDKNPLLHIKRFLASQAIQLSLPGVPGVYIHSILGSRNWAKGVGMTKRARTINREKLNMHTLLDELNHPDGFRSLILRSYTQMIKTRKLQAAFHPNARSSILEIDPRIFSLVRKGANQKIFVMVNISDEALTCSIADAADAAPLRDLIAGKIVQGGKLDLGPYEYVWLEK